MLTCICLVINITVVLYVIISISIIASGFWLAMVQYGMAWHGMAWYSLARYSSMGGIVLQYTKSRYTLNPKP